MRLPLPFVCLIVSYTHAFKQVPLRSDNLHAEYAWAALLALQEWYNSTTGLWETTGWWNSANALTTLADYGAIDPRVEHIMQIVYESTFSQAQRLEVRAVKCMRAHSVVSHETSPPVFQDGYVGFINNYYDDEGWWALAWLKIYDNTRELRFLKMAETIFADMTTGWGAPCGGMWWDKAHTYTGAIENELFLTVAAQLANRVSTAEESHTYLNWALTQWDWFQESGLISPDYNINNGLDLSTCHNDNGTIWSYNQGVILGGLVELHRAFPDPGFLATAEKIALAAIGRLGDSNGILHDVCEPDCGSDGPQFKGIFMRNLRILHAARPNARFAMFIKENAESIWLHDRDGDNHLGLVWSGPFLGATASTQSSACDALVAAIAGE